MRDFWIHYLVKGWDVKQVLTDGIPDGCLHLNTTMAAPIILDYNKHEDELQVNLLFVLKNQNNVVVG